MGCLIVKSHQTTYQTFEQQNTEPYHTIPSLNISSYLEFMYRSYIYISYAVVFKSYIDHVSSNETLLKPSKGVSKVYRNYCTTFRRKKANWNHVSTILKNYCLTILSVKIYATLKACRQSWTMAMEEETQTPWKKYWFLMYLFTFGFKINPISVDLFPNKFTKR